MLVLNYFTQLALATLAVINLALFARVDAANASLEYLGECWSDSISCDGRRTVPIYGTTGENVRVTKCASFQGPFRVVYACGDVNCKSGCSYESSPPHQCFRNATDFGCIRVI